MYIIIIFIENDSGANMSNIPGKGVRKLTLRDQAPDCEMFINKEIYDIGTFSKNKNVVDIGCGFGLYRPVVEAVGGKWTGVEPFEGGAHTVVASAEDLPFDKDTFDLAIMDAVLEHIPDVGKAFSEVARVLKPGGKFIGYVAFMECFHEISYSHLSFKALEYYSNVNGLKLEKISGGSNFGIPYHLKVLIYPIPFGWGVTIISMMIRGLVKTKSWIGYVGLRLRRKLSHKDAKELSHLYYQVECLRQSQGFYFVIVKNNF
jgi:SAM-dependent methyltransferase